MPPSLPVSPTAPLAWTDPARHARFVQWLERVGPAHALVADSVCAASADASFRRYLRVQTRGAAGARGSLIIMDAPPSHEDCAPFVRAGALLEQAGIHVPHVLDWNEADGFLLLSDLGPTTYLSALQDPATGAARSHELMIEAVSALTTLQQARADALPAYDEALQRREMDLFEQWYLSRHLGIELSDEQRAQLGVAQQLILNNTLAQGQVFVHRDYHSRNLMVCEPNPGVLDFQDAVRGPVTYDLVSLLRDAYIPWDEEVQIDYAARYWQQARRAGLPVADDFGQFWRDFEWMGLQRQLKVLGIFARLAHRDDKQQYLGDLPVVWGYAHKVCTRYQGLGPLAALLEQAGGVRREVGHTF